MTRTKLISLTLSFIFLTFLPVLHYSFPREDAKEAFVAAAAVAEVRANLSKDADTARPIELKAPAGAPLKRGANGGFRCATCVILLGLVERWSIVNHKSVDQNLAKFCRLVPNKVCPKLVFFIPLIFPHEISN